MMVNRMRIIWLVLAFVVLAAAGYYLYSSGGVTARLAKQGDDPQRIVAQEAVARIGDLQVSVGGSGELVPTAESELGFAESGVLAELLVEVGDQVQTGDILARLKVDKTSAQRQTEIASAQLAVVNAQQSFDQLYENAQVAAAQALIALEEAQYELEDVQDTQTEQASAQEAIAQAQESVDEAEMQLYIMNSSPAEQAYAIAYSALLFKEKELTELKDDIEDLEYQIKKAPNSMVRERLRMQLLDLQVRLANQQIEVDNAIHKYESLDDQADPIDIQLAEAQMKTAQEQLIAAQEDLADAQAGPGACEIGIAEARLAQAQADWERLQGGPDPDQIALADANLAAAQARLAQAQSQESILELVAPMDGLVTAVAAAEGDRIGGQPADTILTLADISLPMLEVYLDETDLGHVQVGYPAEIVFDALPERTYRGQVTQIYPQLVQAEGGTSAVGALVQLDQTPLEGIQTLPLGLNASVEIIAGQVEGAVLVPLEALHGVESPQDSETYVVYVANGETIERREVSVGLKDYTSAEILHGLQAGETVLLGNEVTLEAELTSNLEPEP